MDLTIDEQRLIAGFRKLTPSGRDELLAFAASLTCRSNVEEPSKGETATNQCKLKNREPHPEAEKTPYFTE
jgi:hypothetical protein